MNGDGAVNVACSNGAPDTSVDPQTMEISSVYFYGSVDVVSPDTDASG